MSLRRHEEGKLFTALSTTSCPPPLCSTDWRIAADNYVHDMQDAGIAVFESFNANIYDNVIEDVRYGIRISLGGGYNYVHENVFRGCSEGEPLSQCPKRMLFRECGQNILAYFAAELLTLLIQLRV